MQKNASLVRRHALTQSLWFISGFSLVFIALGVSATLLGQWLLTHMDILGKIVGVIIVTFGLAIPFFLAALVTDSFLRWSQAFKHYLLFTLGR